MFETPEVLNPFPGLRPFETEENNLFFGRDGQSDELLARLRRTRFLAVVGTSGSGKSSLIRAGLLPALYGGLMGAAGSNWRIAILRPGHDPIGNLASALNEQGVLGADDQDSEIQNTLIETTLRRSSIGVVDAAQQARMSAHENLLIVVDQFEELFRFKEARKETGSEDDAAAFVKLLLEASAQGKVPIYVVLTMRSDFLGDCSQFAGLPEAINDGQYLIPRMSRDERQAAITGPVAVGGGAITLPLVNRLLNDVGDNPDQLPILQHALMRTWDYRAAHRRNGEPIGLEHYEAIGTMSEALSRHADEAFGELPDERSRVISEKLFKRLTEKGADNREIRRPTRLAEVCAVAEATEDEIIAVIDVFRHEGRSFLMPPAGVELQGETVIDISHESLIRNWKRLQAWVDEEAQSARVYRRLAEAATLHREGSEGLLQDPGLQIALDWRDKSRPNAAWAGRYHPEFSESIAYLEQSRAARDAALAESERRRNHELERERREREQAERFAAEQARSARRLRWLAAGMAVMFLLALATAGYATVQRRAALKSARIAEEKERYALGQQQALSAALEVKERAEQQRMIADRAREEADYQRMKAQVSEKAALREAQEKAQIAEKEKIKAEGERERFETEARKNKKAKEANDYFRDAALFVQRGKYQNAKDLFSNAIEAYQDPDVANPEAVADASVEMGHLAYSVAHDSFLRSGELNRGNAMGNMEKFIGEYEKAAKLYAGPSVNSVEKAAATHFSLGVRLLTFVDGTIAKPSTEQPYDEPPPGWEGAEGELPKLSIRWRGQLVQSISAYDYDPVKKVKEQAAEALRRSLAEYHQAFADSSKRGESGRVEVAREGMRKAAYQLGNFHLNEANALESSLPLDPYFAEKAEVAVDTQRRETVRYFEELLSSYDVNDVERGRLLIWLGGLNLALSHGSANEEKQAGEKYFDRVLRAFQELNWTDADALAFVADALKENEQLAEAADFYHRAGQAYSSKGDKVREADMYVDRGQTYEKLYFDMSMPGNVIDRADACYIYATGLYAKLLDTAIVQARPEKLFAIGSFYKRFSADERALEAFELAIKFGGKFKRDDIEIYQARAYSEKASILAPQNKAREALDAYKQALTIYDRLAAARVGVNGSKEAAASEADRIRVIVKALESGLGEKGPVKP